MRALGVLGGIAALLAAVVLVAWLSDFGLQQAGPGVESKPPAAKSDPTRNEKGEYLVNPFKKPTKGPFPRLEVDEKEFKFGKMKYDPNPDFPGASHEFVVRNVGEAPLLLARGPSTCQCTMAALEEKLEVPPGGSTNITITWKPTSPAEEFSKGASIWTNDPSLFDSEQGTSDGKIMFTVSGTVAPGVEFDPPTFSLGALDETKPTTITSHVYSKVVEDLEASVKKTSSQYVTAEMRPMTEEELKERSAVSGWVMTGEIDPKLPVGRVRESIVLSTNDTVTPEFTLSISAQRQGPISLAGRYWNNGGMYVDFKHFRASEGRETQLNLYAARHEEPLELTLVERRPEYLEVVATRDAEFPEPDRERVAILVRVPPGSPPDRLLGQEAGLVRLATNREDVPEVKFYVVYESTE